jgi:hypothetical protein
MRLIDDCISGQKWCEVGRPNVAVSASDLRHSMGEVRFSHDAKNFARLLDRVRCIDRSGWCLVGARAKSPDAVGLATDLSAAAAAPHCAGVLMKWVKRAASASVHGTHYTWLILPVVICLSQRLSHACPRSRP